MGVDATTFDWSGAPKPSGYGILWKGLTDALAKHPHRPGRLFDLGSGNGINARMLAERGYDVTGVEPSEQGVTVARQYAPMCKFHVGTGYDDLAAIHGQFPIVICMEVIEHCYYPRKLAETFYDLIEPGGIGIMSTPYHGYLKNLALSVAGHWDAHFTTLTDGGHIKFFSIATLGSVLSEAGFTNVDFQRIGRIPPLAMSIVATARKT